jgi:nucleotide-binding universal stress UspA family protein
MHPVDIADALNKSHAAVRKALSRMVRANQIVWLKGGFYEVKDEDRDTSDYRYIRHQELKQKTKELFEVITEIVGDEGIDKSRYENLVFSEELFAHIERAYGGADRGG